MLNSPDLGSAEWHRVAKLMSDQPPRVRVLVRYLLVMSMIDSGNAVILRAQVRKGCHYLRIGTTEGEAFYLQRPRISMARELRLREEVKSVMEEG
jgi:hypothetical protein